MALGDLGLRERVGELVDRLRVDKAELPLGTVARCDKQSRRARLSGPPGLLGAVTQVYRDDVEVQ